MSFARHQAVGAYRRWEPPDFDDEGGKKRAALEEAAQAPPPPPEPAPILNFVESAHGLIL